EPDPSRNLPDRHAVVDVHPAARARLPQPRNGACLQGLREPHERRRPGRASAHAHGHRRQRDGDRADPRPRARRPQGRGHGRSRRAPKPARMSWILPLPDPLGAGMAVLALGVTTLSLLYSWTYLRNATRTYDALMLVLGGSMAGFALTGDVFNMFVWFELIGVAAYALAGFNAEEIGPVQ